MPNPRMSLEAEEHLQDLVAKIATGDRIAFEAFYDLTKKRIYGIVLKILGDPELAEEAMLDIYMKIWNQASRYNPAWGLVSVWSNVVARNRALDYVRKKKRIQGFEVSLETTSPANEAHLETPEGNMYRIERANQLLEAMKRLNDESKKLLHASFFQGMSHREIAEAFELPLGTVKTRIRKAMEILRVQLRNVQ